jgi:hypothetical protein
MASRSQRHGRANAPRGRRAPPCMWRGAGMELSDDLYARLPAQGWRGRVKGGASSLKVLHLDIDTVRGRIRHSLNTSDDAKAIERAKAIVAKALGEGRIQPNSLATLTYAPPQSAKPVCCKIQTSGNYSTKIARPDGGVLAMSLETSNDQLAKDRMRVVVGAWLARGLILPTCKAARVYGPGGLDGEYSSQTSLLEAEQWFAGKKRSKPRFMQWARGPGRKRVLQSEVYLSDGSRLCCVLNTENTKIGARRMRLILWHAINKGLLPKRQKHLAWRLYGGPIDLATKRFLKRLSALTPKKYEAERKPAARRLGYSPSTIDWLTDQEEVRRSDPVRQAMLRKNARARGRRAAKQTPISKSWQFSTVGGMLAVHPDGPIYAQLTIAGTTLRWRLPAKDRAEAEVLVKPAVDARGRIKRAADAWRDCMIGSPEAKTALNTLLAEQRRYRDMLLSIGADSSRGWAEVALALNDPPFDETTKPAPDKCKRWFVALLQKNPFHSPRPLLTVGDQIGLIDEAKKRFNVSQREARRCYERAQDVTRIKAWSTTHRGKARKRAF